MPNHIPSDFLQNVRYVPETGEFYWTVSRKRIRVGDRADSKGQNGYRKLMFLGRWYIAHRVAFMLMTGSCPDLIDHINGDRSDNRWSNLRGCSPSENAINRICRKNALARGVVLHKQSGKFQARITKGGCGHYLGLFNTPEEAHAAYLDAAQRLHGEFARAD